MNLRIEALSKTFLSASGATRALDGISLEVGSNELVAVLGPSGCGKTTFLRCLAGLETPDAGRIALGTRVLFDHTSHANIAPHLRNVAMVFQGYALWPHMTVLEHALFALEMKKIPRSERARRAQAMLGLLGISELANRHPHELSGGQQQRVALARALVTAPDLLLLDEPLSSLDVHLKTNVRNQLAALLRARGVATLIVTHDPEDAIALADRIAIVEAGRLTQLGTVEELRSHPATKWIGSVFTEVSPR